MNAKKILFLLCPLVFLIISCTPDDTSFSINSAFFYTRSQIILDYSGEYRGEDVKVFAKTGSEEVEFAYDFSNFGVKNSLVLKLRSDFPVEPVALLKLYDTEGKIKQTIVVNKNRA